MSNTREDDESAKREQRKLAPAILPAAYVLSGTAPPFPSFRSMTPQEQSAVYGIVAEDAEIWLMPPPRSCSVPQAVHQGGTQAGTQAGKKHPKRVPLPNIAVDHPVPCPIRAWC